MQIFIVGLLFLRSRLVFNIGPLGSPTSRGEFETKPGRNLENQGASFPPGKQKQSFSHPGPFHEKRNNYVVLFPRFLVHFGAPGKQSLKSPCFVSSYFPCFNFFPILLSFGIREYKIPRLLGNAFSDLSLLTLDLVAWEMARKHTAPYNIGF